MLTPDQGSYQKKALQLLKGKMEVQIEHGPLIMISTMQIFVFILKMGLHEAA